MASDIDTQTYANDSATSIPASTELAQPRSRDVPRDLLVKRNIAELSKWLNDPDPKPWATHPMQTVAGLMQWQVDCLTKWA